MANKGLFQQYAELLIPYRSKAYSELTLADRREVGRIFQRYFRESTYVTLPFKSFWDRMLLQIGDIWEAFNLIPLMFTFADEYWGKHERIGRSEELLQRDALEFRKYFWGIIKSTIKESGNLMTWKSLSFEDKRRLAELDLARKPKKRGRPRREHQSE